MLIIIPLIVVAICLLLAWFSKSRRIWKICLINVLIIAVYNLVGWLYILNFLGEGGAGLGPGLATHLRHYFTYCVIICGDNSDDNASGGKRSAG